MSIDLDKLQYLKHMFYDLSKYITVHYFIQIQLLPKVSTYIVLNCVHFEFLFLAKNNTNLCKYNNLLMIAFGNCGIVICFKIK